MEIAKKTFYRYCLVPKCKNTIRSAPMKAFFSVPKSGEIRKEWCKVIRKGKQVSPISSLHCCEDHFNIREDTTNYVRYNIMKRQGVKVHLKLKEGVVPHIFQCQKQNMSSPLERMRAKKRTKLSRIKDALSKSTVKTVNDHRARPSARHVDDSQAEPSKGDDTAQFDPKIKMEFESADLGWLGFDLERELYIKLEPEDMTTIKSRELLPKIKLELETPESESLGFDMDKELYIKVEMQELSTKEEVDNETNHHKVVRAEIVPPAEPARRSERIVRSQKRLVEEI